MTAAGKAVQANVKAALDKPREGDRIGVAGSIESHPQRVGRNSSEKNARAALGQFSQRILFENPPRLG